MVSCKLLAACMALVVLAAPALGQSAPSEARPSDSEVAEELSEALDEKEPKAKLPRPPRRDAEIEHGSTCSAK